MNPITYDSAVLMKEEETRAQNTCIISRKSINSSHIPRFKKPTFCKANALSSKLNIFSPLSSRRFACPSSLRRSARPSPLRRSARIVEQRKSRLSQIPAQTTPYTPEENRRGRRILCLSPMGAEFEK